MAFCRRERQKILERLDIAARRMDCCCCVVLAKAVAADADEATAAAVAHPKGVNL